MRSPTGTIGNESRGRRKKKNNQNQVRPTLQLNADCRQQIVISTNQSTNQNNTNDHPYLVPRWDLWVLVGKNPSTTWPASVHDYHQHHFLHSNYSHQLPRTCCPTISLYMSVCSNTVVVVASVWCTNVSPRRSKMPCDRMLRRTDRRCLSMYRCIYIYIYISKHDV